MPIATIMKMKSSRVSLFVATVMLSGLLPSGFAATNVVSISNFRFSPTNITINAGDTIVWSNIVSAAHDTTSSSNLASIPLWTSNPPLGQSNTFAFTFTNAGYYPYFCALHIVQHPEQTGTVSVVTAPNLPPSVLITNPPNGTVFTAPANVTIQASASDDGSVTNVQFLIGSTVVGNDTTAPYSAVTNGLSAGNYTLFAIASDNLGAKSTNSISISVNNPPPAAVTLSNPDFNESSFSFSFNTQTGYTYDSQFVTPLASSNSWQTFTSFAGNGALMSATNFNATNTERYYRVVGH